MKGQRIRPLMVLAGVILIRGFASGGITMTSSLFLTSVSQELGVGIGTLSLYFSVMSAVAVIWLPYAGKLMNRCSVRVLVPAAAALQALTFAAFGLMNHVAGWYLLAIPQAMGTAILTSLLGPVLLNRWFPHNTGLVMGIQMAFVWLFAAVLQPAVSRVIAASGWRTAYVLAGLVTFLAAVLAACLLLRDRPDAVKKEETGTERSNEAGGTETGDGVDIPEKAATRSASFILLLVFMAAMTGAGVFTQHVPTYGGLLGYSLDRIGLAMSVASVGSAIGSLAIGVICDRIGGLKTCYGIIFLWILAAVGFLLSGEGFPVFVASAFLHGAASSSIAVIAPILTLLFYGKRDYEKIYAKVSMGAPLASILLVPGYGFIYDATGSYLAVLVFMLALLCAAAFVIMLGWKKRCSAAGCPARHRLK